MGRRKKNKPGQGRKPIGAERGGLIRYNCRLYQDQYEALMMMDQPQEFMRALVDEGLNKLVEEFDKENFKK